jgi:8-oxo-dGTP pyrophosphatase MutT (NUDIX family)
MSDLDKIMAAGIHPNTRPKDAASILLFDRSGDELKVLVGKRSSKHAFMPDVFVFPGGKRDTGDHRLKFSADLSDETHMALAKTIKKSAGLNRSRALALAAMRELQEETGMLCWDERGQGSGPNLSSLRFFARAITPPRQIRRFDTRFFTAFIDEIGISGPELSESAELHDIHWLSISHKSSVKMHPITQLVLDDAIATMTQVQQSAIQAPVTHYVLRNKRFHRMIL